MVATKCDERCSGPKYLLSCQLCASVVFVRVVLVSSNIAAVNNLHLPVVEQRAPQVKVEVGARARFIPRSVLGVLTNRVRRTTSIIV